MSKQSKNNPDCVTSSQGWDTKGLNSPDLDKLDPWASLPQITVATIHGNGCYQINEHRLKLKAGDTVEFIGTKILINGKKLNLLYKIKKVFYRGFRSLWPFKR